MKTERLQQIYNNLDNIVQPYGADDLDELIAYVWSLRERLHEYRERLAEHRAAADRNVAEWLDDVRRAADEQNMGSLGAASQELADYAGEKYSLNVSIDEFDQLFGDMS
jgi:hypothetical protein